MFNLVNAILVGTLCGLALYAMLQKKKLSIFLGVVVLGHASNMAILAVSENPLAKSAPFIHPYISAYIDPLPQALILTSIVIGFGLNVFILALICSEENQND